MDNLGNTGVSLKQLTVADWASVLEDINHNFAVILSSPLFKGTKGEDGDMGDDGEDGERGVKWSFVNFAAWQTQFPELTSATQITQGFINAKLSTDLNKVLTALSLDRFVDKDVIVIPSQLILSYNADTAVFDLTGASFANNGVTQGQVQSMINSAIASLNLGAKLLKFYDALAKNYIDGGTGGQNNAINPDSILDIATSDSGPGVNLNQDLKFFGMDESSLPTESDWTTILGTSPKKYHQLVQNTQNSEGQTTNEYGPGPLDPATLCLLQASRNNGILLGYKGENTLRNFSRFYRSATDLHITSNYSVYENEFGEVVISSTKIDLRAPVTNIKHQLTVAELATFQGNIIANADVTISDITNASILGTDNTGKIVRGMTIETATLSGSASAVPNSQVVKNEIIRLEALIAALSGSTGADLTEVLNRLDDLELRSLRFVDSVVSNLNQTNRGIRITSIGVTGESLPVNTFGMLTTYKHTANENYLFQLFKCTNYVAFRTAIFSGGAWTYGAWSKLATQAQIDTLTNTINTLQTQVDGLQTTILGAVGVDGDWIGKTGTNPITINHLSKTISTPVYSSGTYETRIPGSVVQSLSTTKNHITGVTTWSIDKGLFPQAGFIQQFIYPLLMPATTSYATIYNKFFNANGRGKLVPPEANVNAPGGMTPTIDLRHYAIMDGRNNTPNAGGLSFVSAGTLLTTRTNQSSGSYFLQNPKSYDEIQTGAYIFRPNNVHGHYAVPLTSAENGPHAHTQQDTIWMEAYNIMIGQSGTSGIVENVGTNKFGGFGSGRTDRDNGGRLYWLLDTSTSGFGAAHQNMTPVLVVFSMMYLGPV